MTLQVLCSFWSMLVCATCGERFNGVSFIVRIKTTGWKVLNSYGNFVQQIKHN